MKKAITSFIFYAFFCSLPLNGDILSQLNSNNDHGIWTEEAVNSQLAYGWSGNFKFEQRLGANYKKVWYYALEAVFQYDLLPLVPCFPLKFTTLSIGPGYNATRQLSKNTEGRYHWVWINRSILQAIVSFDIYQWTIKQRLKGEYYGYTRSHYKDYALYRHRLGIYAPWKFSCLKVNPFVSNEWFFRNNSYSSSNTSGLVGIYYENRFRVGFQTTLSDTLSSTLAWQWRASKQKPGTHPGWFYTYQYCIDLNMKF